MANIIDLTDTPPLPQEMEFLRWIKRSERRLISALPLMRSTVRYYAASSTGDGSGSDTSNVRAFSNLASDIEGSSGDETFLLKAGEVHRIDPTAETSWWVKITANKISIGAWWPDPAAGGEATLDRPRITGFNDVISAGTAWAEVGSTGVYSASLTNTPGFCINPDHPDDPMWEVVFDTDQATTAAIMNSMDTGDIPQGCWSYDSGNNEVLVYIGSDPDTAGIDFEFMPVNSVMGIKSANAGDLLLDSIMVDGFGADPTGNATQNWVIKLSTPEGSMAVVRNCRFRYGPNHVGLIANNSSNEPEETDEGGGFFVYKTDFSGVQRNGTEPFVGFAVDGVEIWAAYCTCSFSHVQRVSATPALPISNSDNFGGVGSNGPFRTHTSTSNHRFVMFHGCEHLPTPYVDDSPAGFNIGDAAVANSPSEIRAWVVGCKCGMPGDNSNEDIARIVTPKDFQFGKGWYAASVACINNHYRVRIIEADSNVLNLSSTQRDNEEHISFNNIVEVIMEDNATGSVLVCMYNNLTTLVAHVYNNYLKMVNNGSGSIRMNRNDSELNFVRNILHFTGSGTLSPSIQTGGAIDTRVNAEQDTSGDNFMEELSSSDLKTHQVLDVGDHPSWGDDFHEASNGSVDGIVLEYDFNGNLRHRTKPSIGPLEVPREYPVFYGGAVSTSIKVGQDTALR